MLNSITEQRDSTFMKSNCRSHFSWQRGHLNFQFDLQQDDHYITWPSINSTDFVAQVTDAVSTSKASFYLQFGFIFDLS